MRIRIKVVLVIAVLLCTVVTLEFPELARLSDDTSNDFSFEVCAVPEVENAVAERQPARLVLKPAAKDRISWNVAQHIWHVPLSSSSDLLTLQCIHRT